MGIFNRKKRKEPEIELMDGVLQRLVSYVTPYRSRLGMAIAFGMLAGLLNGLFMFVLKDVFSVVLPSAGEEDAATHFTPFADLPIGFLQSISIPKPVLEPEKEWIFILAVCMTMPAMLLLRGLFNYLHQYFMLWINNKVLFRLRDECFTSIIRQPIAFFNEAKQGELMHATATQTRACADAGTQMISAWIKHPIAIISILFACFAMDWLYTLGAFTIFPLCILPVALIAKKVKRAGGREEIESEALMVTMQESFDGIRLVKAHARESYQRTRFNRGSRQLLDWLMRWRKAMEISTPLVEAVAAIGISLGLVYAWKTEMTAAEFGTLNLAMIAMYPHAKALSRMHLQMQRCAVAATRVFTHIDRKPSICDLPDARELEVANGPFELRNVKFAYEPETPVLHDLSLTFEPGKKYALVGQSGSGKSTILSLMMRFYDPESGQILLNGRDIREYTQASLRDQIGFVSQEIFHFHDTIRANIRYGQLFASDEEVEEAAKLAHADEFIDKLPDGYSTMLGDKGRTISGGQQQRLSIARAILRDAPILFLDEAMSALDTESEKKVQDAIEKLAAGKTVIAIAHRLSTILDSDEIIVMKNGRVEDKGPHTELVERCPEYKRLYELQFKVEA